MHTDDHTLLLATHRGHEASARALWDRHGPRLVAYARCITCEQASAEDVVQTVMCRLLEMPRTRLAAVADVPAFLASSVRNQAINHLRSVRREGAKCQRHKPANMHVCESGALDADQSDALDRAIASLPRRARELLILKHRAGLTFDQIAAALGANRSTIASRYRAAVDALRLAVDAPLYAGARHE